MIYRTNGKYNRDQFYYKHYDGMWWCYACVDEEENRWEWWAARIETELEKLVKEKKLYIVSFLEFLLTTGTPFEKPGWMSNKIHVLRARNRFEEPINHFYAKVNKKWWDWKDKWIARPCPPSLPVRPSDPAEFEAVMGVKFEVPK